MASQQFDFHIEDYNPLGLRMLCYKRNSLFQF